jgi:hypothetical protein
MAIVRSTTGVFYDLDDNVLEGKEIKEEDLPKEIQRSGPGMGMGPGGPPGNLSGLIQVIVNVPAGGPPPSGTGAQSEGEDDVAGHHRRWHHYGWHNCWRNCWRNCN